LELKTTLDEYFMDEGCCSEDEAGLSNEGISKKDGRTERGLWTRLKN
jgi:hypothetical protein